MCSSMLLVVLSLLAVGDPITVDARRQLFLDDYLIASSQNVTRVIHPATKHPDNPVLRADQALGGRRRHPLRLGARGRGQVPHVVLRWRRRGLCRERRRHPLAQAAPGRGQEGWAGHEPGHSPRLAAGPPGAMPLLYESFGVLRDDRDPEASRRYKLGFLSIQRDFDGPMRDRHHGNQRRGLGVAVSPDGIHWRLEDNWATQATCDGPTHWMFDPAGGRYVLYGRTKYALPEVAAAAADKPWLNFWGRSVIRRRVGRFPALEGNEARLGQACADPRHARPRGERESTR